MRLTRRSALAVAAGFSVARAGDDWVSMFDGRSLKGWKETPFHGRGPVSVRDGMIVLGKGRLTGVVWAGEFPRSGYEIEYEAARLDGNDFFAALTFPVNDAHCEWITGGWDGTVVGLSNLDGNDASENDTSAVYEFAKGRWYAFRLAFAENRIRTWIDQGPLFEIDITHRAVGLRFGDSDLNTPLGFSSYATQTGLRNIRYRRIGPESPKGR